MNNLYLFISENFEENSVIYDKNKQKLVQISIVEEGVCFVNNKLPYNINQTEDRSDIISTFRNNELTTLCEITQYYDSDEKLEKFYSNLNFTRVKILTNLTDYEREFVHLYLLYHIKIEEIALEYLKVCKKSEAKEKREGIFDWFWVIIDFIIGIFV